MVKYNIVYMLPKWWYIHNKNFQSFIWNWISVYCWKPTMIRQSLIFIQCIHIHFDWRIFIFHCAKQLITRFYFTVCSIYFGRSKAFSSQNQKRLHSSLSLGPYKQQMPKLEQKEIDFLWLMEISLSWYEFLLHFFNPYPRVLPAELAPRHFLKKELIDQKTYHIRF